MTERILPEDEELYRVDPDDDDEFDVPESEDDAEGQRLAENEQEQPRTIIQKVAKRSRTWSPATATMMATSESDTPAGACPYCGELVDPDVPGVTYAVGIRSGVGAFFHPGCPAGVMGYTPGPQRPGADSTTP